MQGRTLPEVLSSYIAALRRHQPHGPYHLGGWSAGGIIAYAVAQELMADGEEVASLQLIDSPPPTRGLDRLPDRFFDHCSQVGIFGTELFGEGKTAAEPKVPDWLMPHFRATIELLHDYHAPPMPVDYPNAKKPQVTLIWAGTSPFDGERYAPLPSATKSTDPTDQDTEGMKFLTKPREDFGPGEWADLFPGNEVHVSVIDGEHHFSMMRGEGAVKLGQVLRDTLGGAA